MQSQSLNRYIRQSTIAQISGTGQQRLASASVMIVGCGALGTVSAELLARAGVGHIRLVDHDRVQSENLAGQSLFDEEDAIAGKFKVSAAARKLNRLNSAVVIEPRPVRLSADNVAELFSEVDLVLDGTDNDETRRCINRTCLDQGIPWIFAAVLESYGLVMNIVPGETPCYACLFGSAPDPLDQPQAGGCMLTAAAHVAASLQVSQALRILTGDRDYCREMLYVDAWSPVMEKIEVKGTSTGCPECGFGRKIEVPGPARCYPQELLMMRG